VSAILNAPDVSAVWAVYIDILQSLGFDKVIYGATHFPSGGIIGDPNDALILHHGPQGYADVYIGEELYLHSPTYAWAENHSGFASWDDAAAQMMRDPPTARQKRVVALNQKFGIRAGYVGSLRGVVPGMRGVLGISPAEDLDQRETDLLWRDVGTDIEMFSQLMHLRIANLPQPGQRRPLTSRQREALHWCAQGNSGRWPADSGGDRRSPWADLSGRGSLRSGGARRGQNCQSAGRRPATSAYRDVWARQTACQGRLLPPTGPDRARPHGPPYAAPRSGRG